VKLHHHFVEDFRGYLVLEYVPGLSLKELVLQKGAQDEQTAIAIGIKLCLILKHLHEQYPPVLHRDLSPDNVLLSDDGTVKVVDFNVARQLESSASATVVGKHAYIPPEQFRGKPTCQSDIYALGGTLYYLVTGLEPEPLTTSSPVAYFASQASAAKAHGGSCPVSADFDKIIATATALVPQGRYANAEALLADLSRMQR
nr:serine/threonine protein kinase [Candidatus Obscuribacter sp.]